MKHSRGNGESNGRNPSTLDLSPVLDPTTLAVLPTRPLKSPDPVLTIPIWTLRSR